MRFRASLIRFLHEQDVGGADDEFQLQRFSYLRLLMIQSRQLETHVFRPDAHLDIQDVQELSLFKSLAYGNFIDKPNQTKSNRFVGQ
jgi:hypothetical protein